MRKLRGKKENVALFISSLNKGGAERVLSRLTYILSQKYNVVVFLIDGTCMEYDCGCPIIEVGGGKGTLRKKEIYAWVNLNKFVRKYEIGTLISFMEAANVISIISAKSVRRIITIHSCYSKQLLDTASNKMMYERDILLHKTIYKCADKVVAVSKIQRQILLEEHGFHSDKVITIENPVDIEDVSRLSSLDIEKKINGFMDEHNTIISVGRNCREKNYELMIEIFYMVVQSCPNAGLIIIGEGTEKLRNCVEKYNLSDSVRLIGRVNNPFKYMARSKLYLSTSIREGFPNVLVEAMACGLPIIASDCMTGPKEILSNNGKLVVNSIIETDYGILTPNIGLMKSERERKLRVKETTDMINEMITNESLQKKYSDLSLLRSKSYDTEGCLAKWDKLLDV